MVAHTVSSSTRADEDNFVDLSTSNKTPRQSGSDHRPQVRDSALE